MVTKQERRRWRILSKRFASDIATLNDRAITPAVQQSMLEALPDVRAHAEFRANAV